MTGASSRRAFVLVIDACGAGALPDAASYGDEGTCTIAHLAEAVGGLELPVLGELGLGSILPVAGVAPAGDPAIHGRLAPLGPGKDSITGHWELMGVSLERALPTYPDGFGPELLERLRREIGRPLICNRRDDGLSAIEQFGAEHLRSGALIVYTSQDSVLQLAAHEDVLAPQELYEACRRARAVMSGADAVGRVIARPFSGREGSFARSPGRRDFALAPPRRSYLEELAEDGASVVGVGKIDDLFAGRGLTESLPASDNARALDAVDEQLSRREEGLVFVNLIDTDQVYGHRKDVEGFARALREIDARVGRMIARLRLGDLLVLTADHGVDPAHPGTDHTREYAPLLAVSGEMQARGARHGARHDGLLADVGASALAWLSGRGAPGLPGSAFIS